MLKGIVLYIVMTIAVFSHISGQQVSLFQSISTKDGLPSNYVFDATEDDEGYLWIGTDKGLAKYDGFHWQTFTTGDGLPGNYIGMVKPAGKFGLWLGISSKGLYFFNTQINSCTFITANYLDHFIQTDKEGNLFLYQRSDKEPHLVMGGWINPANPKTINTAFEFSESNTNYAVCVNFKKRKIHMISSAGKTADTAGRFVIHEGWTSDTVISFTQESVINNFVDDNIFSNASSICFIDKRNKNNCVKVFETTNHYLNTLRLQNQTYVWNEKDGLYLVGDDGAVKRFTEEEGLSNNMVTDVYVLKNGRLLISTLGGGLNYKLPDGNAVLNTGDKPVKGLFIKSRSLYAVAENKLLRYDFAGAQAKSWLLTDKNIQSVDVWDDNIYVSSLKGFSIYKKQNNQLRQTAFVPLGAGISNVIKSGNRFFAGSFGNHVQEYSNNNLKPDTATPFVSERMRPIENGYASYNYEDGVQLTWFNGKRITLTVKEGLPSNAVYDVHEYKDTLWICTQKGVAVYANEKIVKTISAQQGIIGNRCVYSFHDKKGNYWIVTDKHAGEYNGNTVVTYTSAAVKDGSNDAVVYGVYNDENNTLVTGTLKNVFFTRLDDLQNNINSSHPQLQQITADGKVIKDTSFVIPLQYNELKFTFRPYSPNPFSGSAIYFRIDGLDNNFTELKDSLIIHFNKLRSGNYKLVAFSVNEDGMRSSEVVLCSFTVNKPFWQTNWFVLMALLCTGALTYYVTILYQRGKQKRKEKERKLEQQLDKERERISRELHDNLGSSLVTMIAQTDNIETKLRYHQTEDALNKVQELSDQSRETMNILRETIWAVQEKSHSLESFINRTRDFLQRTYAVTNTEWECIADGEMEKTLTPEQTLNLFRCIQECTQNIIKHAGAAKAKYEFNAAASQLNITVTDNGKGFNTNNNYTSNGLKNIKQRTDEMHGELFIHSEPGSGTVVIIKLNV